MTVIGIRGEGDASLRLIDHVKEVSTGCSASWDGTVEFLGPRHFAFWYFSAELQVAVDEVVSVDGVERVIVLEPAAGSVS